MFVSVFVFVILLGFVSIWILEHYMGSLFEHCRHGHCEKSVFHLSAKRFVFTVAAPGVPYL